MPTVKIEELTGKEIVGLYRTTEQGYLSLLSNFRYYMVRERKTKMQVFREIISYKWEMEKFGAEIKRRNIHVVFNKKRRK